MRFKAYGIQKDRIRSTEYPETNQAAPGGASVRARGWICRGLSRPLKIPFFLGAGLGVLFGTLFVVLFESFTLFPGFFPFRGTKKGLPPPGPGFHGASFRGNAGKKLQRKSKTHTFSKKTVAHPSLKWYTEADGRWGKPETGGGAIQPGPGQNGGLKNPRLEKQAKTKAALRRPSLISKEDGQ